MVLVLLLAIVAARPAAGDEPSDAARLMRLVRQECGSCHGLTLQGGLGKPLTPEGLAHLARAQVASIILDGIPGSPMPPWRPLLSEADANWIATALKQGHIR
jgi:cytochrome c55X